MKKIIWILILLVVVYILLIFKAPNLTTEIEKLAGIEGLTELVTSIK
jgi:competence protein ComGC